MQRRTFLKAAPAGAMAAAQAAGAPPGEGILLGFDSYSIRDLKWKATKLIDYTAGLKLDTIQISSIDDYESFEPAYLGKVKDQAARLGIRIDGGIGCICPTSVSWSAKYGQPGEYVLKGLQISKAVGATCMRCFVGTAADRRGKIPVDAHLENTIKVLRGVRSQALDTGVKVAIENHNGDVTAREVKTIIEEAGKDLVGANLDTGNPMWLLEDPMLTLEVLGPYTVTSHIRDSALYEHPRGAAFQWVALGDGSMDLPRIVSTFRKMCPQAAMQLEIITGRPPQMLPYLEPDFWRAFPKLPAADFARFLALVKRGHPFEGTMIIAGTGKQPAEYESALALQQRLDLERSFEYAKKILGVGVRWKT
jgi:sugar phosphate isomerase/epimerase